MATDPYHRLRWKLAKVFRRPVDDEFFLRFSKLDWQYYQAMFIEDELESRKTIQGYLDFLAMFINPKGFKSVMDQRNNSSDVIKSAETTEEFAEQVERLFGRKPKF